MKQSKLQEKQERKQRLIKQVSQLYKALPSDKRLILKERILSGYYRRDSSSNAKASLITANNSDSL